jgi:hypothetical protein
LILAFQSFLLRCAVNPDFYALYARFRITINFPSLDMIGEHGFSLIPKAPDAILNALTKTVKK